MAKEVFTLDGGKISEFERLGLGNFDFLSYPQECNKEEMVSTLESIHLSYLLAGCNVISTNTFQVNLHSLQEKGISIEEGQGIIDTYIDIAHNALLKYERIKRTTDFPLHLGMTQVEEKESSPYDHLEKFQKMRIHWGILHPNDSVDTREYVDRFDLNDDVWTGNPIRRCQDYYVAFSTGGYSSAFRDFSEYSGVLRKERKATNWGDGGGVVQPDKAVVGCRSQNQSYDIIIKTPPEVEGSLMHRQNQLPDIEMVPLSSTQRSATSTEDFPNKHFFNYGLEYYIDVRDEEIISNSKFRIDSYKRNEHKLQLFSVITSSNVREVFTLYHHLKTCGGGFEKNVVVSFYCNSNKNIGCTDYSFLDMVLTLLYLDSRNHFIKAIGVNCVNIDYVRELILPLTRCIKPDGNIDVNAYPCPNGELGRLIKTVLKDLKKNTYLGDIHFFASPNKSLNRVTYDHSRNDIQFDISQKRHKHLYNYVGDWIDVGLTGFGGCCYYNPYDISLLDYKLGRMAQMQ
ncbi:homocysteine S-methyltransferase, putative [Plasmodium knowlesi strain H]|uniref:Homocysteine S-methyltransferase, putative n=3 Tax=Plasmodium knowlesi TaxID=5850 RepID=A0A5K1V7V6_PLAKH|nr:homocysteine S-methyltransferase, putative [Plasmodium knowlesi strain H]OTN64276.1 putative Homocysteine S-methyltransferase [Plasmodium knowlesi]CAA9991127.1 homocysteine S-methyltransferase, putative [Plasmodium knowlesi strain H]SBO20559.1 homocysteine S-methyltransferase, putative [Plasmodium knowlesi strain H]SBO20946.1 homocysteine S-methyltransferase, putative [Plasmodium knowlesi strain H]VVS80601.1 homocysteine S-methyltransferase, putative [Plasmodium knowlesi strain H]|eukprot:XP_002262411.1 hypothetical protein, conserved in Plasmodium species [Plasmodium knowlesi strain H]